MARIITTSLGDKVEICKGMHFVCATDKWLSGWGCAENRTAKRVIICKTYREAQRIADAFNRNPDSMMSYINIRSSFPNYPTSRYTTSFSLYEDFNHDNWMKWTNIPEQTY